MEQQNSQYSPNEQKEPNYTLRRIIFGTVLFAALYFGFCNSKPDQKTSELRGQAKAVPVLKQKQTELSDIVQYRKSNPEEFAGLITSENINDYIQSNPEEANKVYSLVWNFMSSNNIKLNDKNFLSAFKYFRKELEKNPSLSDHLGNRFASHQKDKILKQYLSGMGSAVKNLAKDGYDAFNGIKGE